MSPFAAVYGRPAPSIVFCRGSASPVAEVDQWLLARDCILQDLKSNLCKAQERMKFQADKGRREVEFEVGNQVFLKMQPYRLRSLARHLNQKLSPRYYGPFKIVQRVGSVAYKLELPSYAKIHPVFHVSQLKRATNAAVPVLNLPAELTEALELRVKPAAVLKVRTAENGRKEVLIRWEGSPECDDSWEEVDIMTSEFPSFNLEDKVVLEGGIDGPQVDGLALLQPFEKTYHRRKPNPNATMQGNLGIVSLVDMWQAVNESLEWESSDGYKESMTDAEVG